MKLETVALAGQDLQVALSPNCLGATCDVLWHKVLWSELGKRWFILFPNHRQKVICRKISVAHKQIALVVYRVSPCYPFISLFFLLFHPTSAVTFTSAHGWTHSTHTYTYAHSQVTGLAIS